MRQLKENTNLPDFVTMTNHCEEKGYEIKIMPVIDGYSCRVYKKNKFVKAGEIIYKSCIDAQKDAYTKLYKYIEQC